MNILTRRVRRAMVWVALVATSAAPWSASADDPLPELITPKASKAVTAGLNFLAKQQLSDGSFNGGDAEAYPTAMAGLSGMAFLASGSTSTRGEYADQIRRCMQYLARSQQESGLIAAGNENGRPMYGHGFGLLFLASAYGMETDPERRKRMHDVIVKAIDLTVGGQSDRGGWYYTPRSSDEGSVTVTQLQALRACRNAGFDVPEKCVEAAIKYLEICRTSEGGIRYSFGSGGDTRPAITAAAICCLYSSGEYDSPLAADCLAYIERFHGNQGVSGMGHDYYHHYYAAQALFQASEDHWQDYFPKLRDYLLAEQSADGSWGNGSWSSGVGAVYGTAMCCTIMQLPYRYLPIYQR